MSLGKWELKQRDTITCLLERPESGTPTPPPNAGKDAEPRESSVTAGGDADGAATLETVRLFLPELTHSYCTNQHAYALVFFPKELKSSVHTHGYRNFTHNCL